MLEKNSESQVHVEKVEEPRSGPSIAFGIERLGLIPMRAPILSCIVLVLLLIGAASGAVDPLRPLQQFAGSGGAASAEAQAEELHWRPVNNLTGLSLALDQARAEGRPAMLDLYADWCISCKVMERSVFPRPDVASKLAQFNLLRADITDNNDDHQALLQHFGLFGPPSLLFFSPDGSELADVRIQGDIDAKGLANHLRAILDLSGDQNIVEIAGNFR